MDKGFRPTDARELCAVNYLFFAVATLVFTALETLVCALDDKLDRFVHENRLHGVGEAVRIAHLVRSVVFVE